MDAFVARHRRLAAVRDRVAAILPRGVILLSALTFTSYVMGLVRDRVFARTYGAGGELDTYNAALVLPELVLAILVVAGLSSAFIPVYSRIHHDEPDATEGFARTVLTASVLMMIVVVGVLFVIAPSGAPGTRAMQFLVASCGSPIQRSCTTAVPRS
jgi:peptidoglycan biosynthesis protein MviN/MurJ (putative lipid II flippase)